MGCRRESDCGLNRCCIECDENCNSRCDVMDCYEFAEECEDYEEMEE